MAVIAVLADITEVRELRETALRRAKVIERQLGELQGAYRDIKARNAALSRMTKKVQVARVAATLFVVALFVAIGAWHVRPLDLFREAVAPQALAGVDAGEPAALHTMSVEPGVLRATLSLRGHLAPGRVVKIAGVVVAAERTGDKPLARGRPVAQGELLVNIADFERVSVLTNVDEVDVGKIEASQRAWITGPGFPDLPTSRPAPSTPPPPAR